MPRSAMKKRSRENENARERKHRYLRRITLDGVQSSPVVKDEQSAAYQREWYAKNQEKAKASVRERMRRYRERNREKLTMQRQKHQGMQRRIYLASKRCAGWRWQVGVARELTTQFVSTIEGKNVGPTVDHKTIQSAWDWYDQWFASLDEPELYPWS